MSGSHQFSDDCDRRTDIVTLYESARGMRPLGHPDFQYTPWTPERRAAASKAARERAKAAGAKSVAKTQRKKAAPWSAKGTVNDTKRHGRYWGVGQAGAVGGYVPFIQ
jgi:hypothetical protein